MEEKKNTFKKEKKKADESVSMLMSLSEMENKTIQRVSRFRQYAFYMNEFEHLSDTCQKLTEIIEKLKN